MTDIDLQALREAGYDLVRRPTGGKAILHIDELTYSVIVPETDPRVAGGIVESYRRLSTALVYGLEQLGVPDVAADQKAQNHRQKGPVCFEVPSDYEITAGGRKLAGSAQMRAQSVVLQHGALPLWGNIARICPLLASRPSPARVLARATTVAEALGKTITWDEAADAIATGFAATLNLHLEPGTLSEEERACVDELRMQKYAAEAWTRRVA
jgi:lipoate-protein ligase A